MNWPKPQTSGIRLSEAQRLDWLRLTRTEGVGPLTFKGLVNRYGGAGAALEALPALLKARGKAVSAIPSLGDAERELDAAHRLGVQFIALGEPDRKSVV